MQSLIIHNISSHGAVWKRDIFKKVQYIHRKNKELNELEKSCNHLCKLILRINSNSGIIEANKFPEICYNNYLLYTQCEKVIE